MLPRNRKQRPPNILRSDRPGAGPKRSRTRSANPSSKAMIETRSSARLAHPLTAVRWSRPCRSISRQCPGQRRYELPPLQRKRRLSAPHVRCPPRRGKLTAYWGHPCRPAAQARSDLVEPLSPFPSSFDSSGVVDSCRLFHSSAAAARSSGMASPRPAKDLQEAPVVAGGCDGPTRPQRIWPRLTATR